MNQQDVYSNLWLDQKTKGKLQKLFSDLQAYPKGKQ